MAQAKRTVSGARSRAATSLAALLLALSALGGCVVSGVDGGPHPEPPDELGPPASQVDGGFTGNPDSEGPGTGGGSPAGGSGGAGGGGGEGARGEESPPVCEGDAAGADASWDDEDAGALR